MEFGDKVKNAKFIKAREWSISRAKKKLISIFKVTSMRLRISFSTLASSHDDVENWIFILSFRS